MAPPCDTAVAPCVGATRALALLILLTAMSACAATPRSGPITQAASSTPSLSSDQVIDRYFQDIEQFWSGVSVPGADRPVTVRTVVGYRPDGAQALPFCDGAPLARETAVHNAFFCGVEQIIAVDTEFLVPELLDTAGPGAVGILLAHEYGHAVQAQTGREVRSQTAELQADCLAGAWAGSTASTDSPVVDDAVLRSMVGHGDPADLVDTDLAHGSGFDRVSALVLGITGGVQTCLDAAAPALSTSVPSVGTNPTRPLTDLLDRVGTSVPPFSAAAGTGDPVRIVTSSEIGPGTPCDGEPIDDVRGRVLVCPAERMVLADTVELLPALWSGSGDPAAAYLVVAARNQAVIAAAAPGAADAAVTLAADCAAGTWLAQHVDEAGTVGSIGSLTARDLDEAMLGLLAGPPARVRVTGVQPSSVERISAVRMGFRDGTAACRLP